MLSLLTVAEISHHTSHHTAVTAKYDLTSRVYFFRLQPFPLDECVCCTVKNYLHALTNKIGFAEGCLPVHLYF